MADLAPDWLAAWATADPQTLALHAASGTWTAGQLDGAATAMADRLAQLGLRPDAVVCALVEDDGPAVLLTHAVRRLGAVLLPLNRRAAVPELLAQVRAATPRPARPR